MSIVVRFHPTNLTVAQYEDVVRREEGTKEVSTGRQGVPRLASGLTGTSTSVKSGTPKRSSRRTAKS
jgi:hypothetical protein